MVLELLRRLQSLWVAFNSAGAAQASSRSNAAQLHACGPLTAAHAAREIMGLLSCVCTPGAGGTHQHL